MEERKKKEEAGERGFHHRQKFVCFDALGSGCKL